MSIYTRYAYSLIKRVSNVGQSTTKRGAQTVPGLPACLGSDDGVTFAKATTNSAAVINVP